MWIGVVFEELSPELVRSRSVDREAAEETYLLKHRWRLAPFYLLLFIHMHLAIATSLFCI